MKKNIAAILAIVCMLSANLFSQQGPITQPSQQSRNSGKGISTVAPTGDPTYPVNISESKTQNNTSIALRNTLKARRNSPAASDNSYFVPMLLIYTIGQLLLLSLIFYERGLESKKNAAENYTMAEEGSFN